MAKVTATCEYVQDGDTFRTAKQDWIRLTDVSAPELDEAAGITAKNILASLILGKPITYEQVGTSYGRIVAEVWVNNLYVNGHMRQQGYTCS